MTICEPNEFLRETHIIGPNCKELSVDSERFPILRNAPFIWIGYSVLQPPYRMVRRSSVHSHIVATVSGKGRAWIDGKCVDWLPGQALLGPVGVHHAFEASTPEPWTIAWVFYDDTVAKPVLQNGKAELIDAQTEDFAALVRMITREASGPAQPAVMTSLVGLLDIAARRLANTKPIDQRLWKLWSKVESDLAKDWSVAEMARLASTSEEHLRRLCQDRFGKSPIKHLTYLRLSKAAAMIRSQSGSIEETAQRVGYANVYSFSTAFKRCLGLPPARYRNASQ